MVDEDTRETTGRLVIVSGGSGSSARQIVETALSQFPGVRIPIIEITLIRSLDKIVEAMSDAERHGDLVVHTLVDRKLREELVRIAEEKRVPVFDLLGPLLEQLSCAFQREPVGQPGIYRESRREYFERIEAIEFTVAHDDGQHPEDLPAADIVLLGVSRCGKTPLSMYLAVFGWKVFNQPFVAGQPLPDQLKGVDPRRVVGLSLEPRSLLEFRRSRQASLGVPGSFPYADPSAVYEEMEEALATFRRSRFAVVDMTDKPVETSAEQIISLMTRSFGPKSRA